MAEPDIEVRLDAAYQPLLAVEAELRKIGHYDPRSAQLAEMIWSVVEELQAIKRVLSDA